MPSKFYGIAAAGRPTIFVGSPLGEIARTLAHYRCGCTVSSGDGEALADRILELASNRALCSEMGARARDAFEAKDDATLAFRFGVLPAELDACRGETGHVPTWA